MPRNIAGKRNPNYVSVPKEQLEEQILEGLTSKELANHFDVSQNTITNKVNKYWDDSLGSVRKKIYFENNKFGSCKVCGGPLKRTQDQFCSNKCKFSDKEYNKSRKRTVQNDENKKAVCKKCGYETDDYNNVAGSLTKHRNTEHPDEDVENLFRIEEKEKVEYLECPECDWKTADLHNRSGTFTKHIKSQHGGILSFIERNEEFKPLFSVRSIERKEREVELENNEESRVECKICGEYFRKISNTHLQKHGITPEEYKKKFNVFNLNSSKTSDLQSDITTELNHNGIFRSPNNSSYEDDLKKKLKQANINFQHSFSLNGYEFDFYIDDLNLVLEVDGKAFHPDQLHFLNFIKMNSAINDYNKERSVETDYRFKRIRYDKDNFQFEGLQELKAAITEYSYDIDTSLDFKTPILTPDYIGRYIEHKGTDKLKNHVPLILKFIRTFQLNFPIPMAKRSLNEIIEKLSTYDYSKVFDLENKVVNNNSWNIGVRYLKANFESFWKSSFKNNLSPYEVWEDDRKLMKIISHRIGLNSNQRIYGLSLEELVRGISAYRYTVSFFKPVVAGAIYDHFLNDTESPVVLDPCAGFGGRMVGFKSVFPNGTYIGVEPNPETFGELSELAENFDNVWLFNQKIENFEFNQSVDLTFTSIPYYDKEIYSNHVEYYTFNNWKNTFLDKIKTLPNLVINVPKEFESYFDYTERFKLLKNKSHFQQNVDENYELILKCFKDA